MDIKKIRQKKLKLLKNNYKNQRELADALNKEAAYVNQLLSGHRSIGEKVAREFEETLELPNLWFDKEISYENDEPNQLLVNEHILESGRYVYSKKHIELLAAFDLLTEDQKNEILNTATKSAIENEETFKKLKPIFDKDQQI